MTLTDKLDAIRAGLVKPLEWQHYPEGFPPFWAAYVPFGSYYVQDESDGENTQYRAEDPFHRGISEHDGLPEAKAAAQADYEQRILSALDLTAIDALVRERDEAREQVVCRDLTCSELASRADALATENAALKGLVEWQPIETCNPTDGMDALVWVEGHLPMLGRWIAHTALYNYEPCWWSNGVPILPQPTHWKPVSAPRPRGLQWPVSAA